MAVNDDVVPESYPYYWSSESSLAIKDFLAKVRDYMPTFNGILKSLCSYPCSSLSTNHPWFRTTALNRWVPPLCRRGMHIQWSSAIVQWLWVQKSPLEDDVDARSAATEEAVEYCESFSVSGAPVLIFILC